MIRGLTIGKFYPPHLGHSHLIETALKQCDRLTVLVCDRTGQQIAASLRAEWLREMHPGIEVLVIEDIGHDDDSQIWADYTRRTLGWTPNIVFTSENYGEPWAASLGCRNILVDQSRLVVPISATRIREDPYKWWHFLGRPVRAHYAIRICIVGAESTGTSTMAQALAKNYETVWVPEFGRIYSEGKWPSPEYAKWDTREFLFIAETQNRLEDEMARRCNKILICDTNSFATRLWQERYLGASSTELDSIARNRRYDLYLLTADDIPFIQDGFRDGEQIRHAMQQRFVDELQKQNAPWLLLDGTHDRRMERAVKVCNNLLNENDRRPYQPAVVSD